jgi:Arc/MetJ-type ribon-helix-helix transcriptional regulator
VWNLQVPKTLDEALEKAISMDMHRTKTEYIRDAVRRMLETQGLYPQKLGNKEK